MDDGSVRNNFTILESVDCDFYLRILRKKCSDVDENNAILVYR